MKYVIDKEICIGCGLCQSICPEVFSVGEDEKATAKEIIPKAAEDSAKEAMESCPVAAITEEK